MKPEQWMPVGVAALEESALEVVRSAGHRSVIAGPGAGKTELLAQRAAFLLQTGASRSPRRILAISFKRDAAANLMARVRARCHPRQADRLDSMTFSAFAKSLLDRFGQGLPEAWRPTPDYQILIPRKGFYADFLSDLRKVPPEVGTVEDISAILHKSFERDFVLANPLQEEGFDAPTPGQWAAECFWLTALHVYKPSQLTFEMLTRLAELLVRVNPQIRSALQVTYSHVFLDEFQDTTREQYDLVRAIFLGSESEITAVGDNKQQIMRWAGAMRDPFAAFEQDFGAQRVPLSNNYRSSSNLVQMQAVLARALDPRAVTPVPMASLVRTVGTCELWNFTKAEEEAQGLADFVSRVTRDEALDPDEVVILVRQLPQNYLAELEPAFGSRGLRLFNAAGKIGEIVLQDLLVEDASRWIIDVLRLAMVTDARQYWISSQIALRRLWGGSSEDERVQALLARDLDAFVTQLRCRYAGPPASMDTVASLIGEIADFLGRERMAAAIPSYEQGDWLEQVLRCIATHLHRCSEGSQGWKDALDAYEGVGATPLMTIHKSKGLEYHTVIFVGLDDQAWWNFSKDEHEAKASLFVAFTRAKQRIIFTYCRERGARADIAALYELLQEAGVPSRNMT
ncbi:ATP-dependent helicase [Stenotrophomonas sp. CCNWLW162]|uniref:ATP-dependent helicase n=1 Tax=Stenotrophomonas sp. CCNWLW162 TaxID=3127480 RepID=UPI003077A1E5